MKRIFKPITFITICLAIILSMSGCQLITITNTPSSSTPNTSSSISSPSSLGTNGSTIDSKTHNVQSASIVTTLNGTEELTKEEATALVYESVVTIESTCSDGIACGAGTIIDVNINYSGTVDSAGYLYVLTCHHVIEGASAISVYLPKKLADGETYDFYEYEFDAALIGGDKQSDLAIIRIDLKNNPYGLTQNDVYKVKVNNDIVKVGQSVIAIGNPLGELPGTATYGRVSCLNREITVGDIGEMTLNQIDAQVNIGNSGGGLFNLYGQLIGVVNSGIEGYEGLGFAIAVKGDDGVENIIEQLLTSQTNTNFGFVTGRWMLGTSLSDVSGVTGATVSAIDENGDFYKAGIRKNNVITKVVYNNGTTNVTTTIKNTQAFTNVYYDMKDCLKAGDTFKVTLNTGAEKTVTLSQYIYCDTGL